MPARKALRLLVGTLFVVALIAVGVAAIIRPWAEHGADRSYDTAVAQPGLALKKPRVTFDHGHGNIHSATGRFAPFAALLRADGCVVREASSVIDAALLEGTDILVLVNAQGPTDADRAAPAFSADEIAAIRTWVERGGSLLLAADHHPCGPAAAGLAQAFGVTMVGGWCEDAANLYPGTADSGAIAYRRDRQAIAPHAITDGLNVVVTFTGQSLVAPADAAALLLCAPSAIDQVPIGSKSQTQGTTTTTTFETKDTSAAGHCQALAMTVGAGRVVMTGEAAMLTAQVDNESGLKFGMNVPGIDNRQFVLNVVRWLAR